MRSVTCNKCNWVHMALSLKHIKEQESRGGAKVKEYMNCFNCDGPYFNFRTAEKGDCPGGCTIQPILDPSERFGQTEK